MPLILGANSLAGGYQIKNSARFNSGSSDYLSRTYGTPTNNLKYTKSFWIKRSGLSSIAKGFVFSSSTNSNTDYFYFTDSDTIVLGNATTPATTAVFRDVSAWYHCVMVFDSANATASNRLILYINNVQQTLSTTITQNSTGGNESGVNYYIGYQSVLSRYLDAYMSEIYMIDGQALTPSSFGETDTDTGIWIPKAYTGTYGTNGFYLDFEDSANLGNDMSGNNNDFTVNNLTSIDQTTDTPTNNFCTLNALETSSSSTLSEGNLFLTSGDGSLGAGTMGVASGKWYFECKITQQVSEDNGHPIIGIINENTYAPSIGSPNVNSWGIKTQGATYNGKKSNNGTDTATDTTFANDDIVMVAFDVSNSKVWFGKNGTWVDSGNPATGSNPAFSNLSGTFIRPLSGGYNSSVAKFNFGNPAFTIVSGNADANGYGNFEYAVPSGYYALCTKNLAQYG